MVSSAPVVSPTLIIWHTMGGKTLLSMRGSAIVCPLAMLWRAFMMAYSTTLLPAVRARSEEHTSELQSLTNLVGRLLLEKKKKNKPTKQNHYTNNTTCS